MPSFYLHLDEDIMPAATRLPAIIKVGHRKIAVELTPPDHMTGNDGDFYRHKSRIRISEELLPQDRAEVLIHEVLHACWIRVSLNGDIEENAITILAENLAQVWRDNPKLVAYLSAALK